MKHQRMLELPQKELLVTPLKAPTISTKKKIAFPMLRTFLSLKIAPQNLPHCKVATKQ